MVYTGTYIDENGVGHEISLTEEDSIEALKNDRDALLRRYNTQRVTVRQVKAQEGRIVIVALTPAVADVLRIARFDLIFPLFGDLETAMKSLA